MDLEVNQGPAFDLRRERQMRITGNLARIKHAVLVLSGKGGVGKTTVAVNLAAVFAVRGYRVGLIDVDLHGPNAAKMAGVKEGSIEIIDGLIHPAEASGFQVLSLAGLLPSNSAAVIWRGPMKHTAIEQFLADSDFGELDLMVVDAPPGTGDEPMSVAQLMPSADGCVIVTSPQDVALMDGRRAVSFARQVNLPVLGMVENFSALECPHCGGRIEIFGPSKTERAAHALGTAFLGSVPFSIRGAESGDRGEPLVLSHPDDPAALALREIAERLSRAIRMGEETQPNGKRKMGGRMGEMSVAIACEDDRGLEAEVSPHFGRCPYYTVARVEGDRVVGHDVVENPHHGNHQPGVMPEFIQSLGVDAILAGGMGPRAAQMFAAYGIDVATGAVGVAGKVLEAYLSGALTGYKPCHHDHPESCG